MKIFLFFMLLISFLYANYSNEQKGKIDMHGGKGDKLIEKRNDFSSGSFSLSNVGINKKRDDNTTKEK